MTPAWTGKAAAQGRGPLQGTQQVGQLCSGMEGDGPGEFLGEQRKAGGGVGYHKAASGPHVKVALVQAMGQLQACQGQGGLCGSV